MMPPYSELISEHRTETGQIIGSWLDLLDEDAIFEMSVVELRGHLAMLAAPESDYDLAWAVITGGSTVNALFGRKGPMASKRARAAKSYLQNLDERDHLAVIQYYRTAIIEMMEYHESEARLSCCARMCGASNDLRKAAQFGLWEARSELERSLKSS
eukprot:CAMPEP_0171458138 /NCGR_PEP_ID=MMETSP0945-20130129/3938_1 /TAXON_ID=109269 /ORGANISM="Vaucheria litorea, Strain CCMP2940" /LENGTH=156 /DNA_ID=CAMNT_0011983889 /DNA_START=31 /DNA_END=497 /DNA_ORIENTATION=-